MLLNGFIAFASISLSHAYKIDFYKGEQCRGAPLGSLKPFAGGGSCIDESTQALSAYIVHNDERDSSHELIFWTGTGCNGEVLTGAGGPGCVTFGGGLRSVESRPFGSKRDTQPSNGNWMNSVHTVNNIYRVNNMTAKDDDEDMEEGWLSLGLGRWIGVPDDKTYFGWAQELDEMGFVTRAWEEADLIELADDVVVDDPADDGAEMLPGTSPAPDTIFARDSFLGVRCSRTVTCAFSVVNGVQASYNQFTKIYDGILDSRLWKTLNAGLVASAITNYYWTKTTKDVDASTCDKNDKQCLLDALADNFDQFPRQSIDTRNEQVKTFDDGVSGKSEWQAREKKPKKAMPLKC